MDLYTQNETSTAIPKCVGAQADVLHNGTSNESLEASNITCGNAFTLLIPRRVRQRGERIHRKLNICYIEVN